MIGGDQVEVIPLMPAGENPETWNPDDAQLQQLAVADLIIVNGSMLEKWIQRVSLPFSTLSDSSSDLRGEMRFESARDVIRKAAIETFDNSALFSFGQAKPVTIAVPSNGQWEGLSVDRANLGQPGLITIDKGKVHGPSEDYMLDPGTIKRAFCQFIATPIITLFEAIMNEKHGEVKKM